MLQSDFVLGIGNRWANRHTGSVEIYTKGRKFVHVDIEPTQIGRVFKPDLGIVSDAKAALELFVDGGQGMAKAGKLQRAQAWPAECQDRKRTMLRKTNFDDVPIKPQRVYEEMNQGVRPRHLLRQRDRPVADRRRAVPARLQAAQLDQLRPGRPAGLDACPPRSACAPPIPTREIVALSGDYDFQFLIEELAVGAQFKLPYIHVVVNNSYLGLIRQAQRGFEMDYLRAARRSRTSTRRSSACYGVDHVAVAEGLGCKAIRVTDPDETQAAFATAREWMAEYQVPVVIEFILERVTNIAMGTEIDNIIEFEEVLDLPLDDAPTAVGRVAAACCRPEGDIDRCPNLPPTSPCCSPSCRSSIASPRPRPPASAASNICSPMISTRPSCSEQLQQHGLTQVLHNLPAGNWDGRRARHRLPARPGRANSATASRRAIDYATALDCRQLNCLVGIAPAGRRRGASCNEVLVENLRFAADALAKERHPAADRADQHARHPRLLPERHRAGARS